MSNQEKWDHRFLELAKHVSTWSKDPSTQVGSILVNRFNRVVGLGFNGFPQGCDDDPYIYNDRPRKYRRIVHAEVNAILMAGEKAEGCKMYNYPTFAVPAICCDCCKLIIQAGVSEVICYAPNNTPKELERLTRPRSDGSNWDESIKEARAMCDEAGVIYRTIACEPNETL